MLTHGNMTVYTLLKKQAKKYHSKSFLLYEDLDISYHDMFEKVNRLARWLKSQQIKKGDTVAVYLSNSPLFYEAWYACSAIGAILLPINTASTPNELEYFLSHSESKGLIFEEQLLNDKHLEIVAASQLLFSQSESTEWENEKRVLSAEPIEDDVKTSDVAGIMYTSGTTAKPKGVLITHENYLFAGHTSILYQQLTPEDRYLIFLPLFHANSQYYTSMSTLMVGGTIILLKRFSSSTFWRDVQKYRPTVSSLVATTIKMLLNMPPSKDEENHTLKRAGYGLFVTYNDLLKFQDRFQIQLYQWYGMTETMTTNIVTPLYEDLTVDSETGIVSIGKPGLGHEVKIINEQGEELPPYEVGEIIIKSPSLMKGYFKNPEATAETLQDGWLHTGDNGYYNEEGFIWFVDRDKDMIKRAGENISSIEVENVLSDHPSVKECAVIGEPDHLREEIVVAYVMLNEGFAKDEEQLKAYCKENLSYFKVPEQFKFVDAFPRTSIGKIQKNLLK